MQTTGTTIASREKDPEPLQGEGLEAGKISSSGGVCSHDRPSNPLLDEGPIMDESRIKRIEAEAQVLLKIASRVMRGDVPVECKRHVGNRWLKEREALLDQLGQSGGAA